MDIMIKEQLKKMKILYIPWHKFRIKLNQHREMKKKKAYSKYGIDALNIIADVLKEEELRFVCTEGTLLGLARDGRLISWDDDLDFTIMDDGNIPWDKLEKSLLKKGFWKYREKEKDGKLISQAYKYKNVHCDFTSWQKGGDTVHICYGCYEYDNIKYKNGVESLYRVWDIEVPEISNITWKQLDEHYIPMPENYKEILSAIYGDWKIPNSNYKPNRVERKEYFKFTYFSKNGCVKRYL